jgi:CRISPR-associated protein Cas1
MKEHTRYLFSDGELLRKDFSIMFRNDKGNNYLPIKDTKELFCFSEVKLSTKFLELISKAGITVHFFNYYRNYIGSFYPKEYLISGDLTVKQALAYKDKRIIIAKSIINGIAENIHELLYHYYRHGKVELKEYLSWLKKDIPRILSLTDNIKQLLMIEGQIWSRFYHTFRSFLPEDFVINKRVRRPPDNPINALISFGNSILYSKTVTQIYHTHLNQSISYLHEPSEGRFSLSLDLSEAFKPVIVFRTIFDCVNNRKLQVSKHFDSKLNYCILNEIGKKVFIEAIEERLNKVFEHSVLKRKITYKNAIKLDGYKLIKFIIEGKAFKPFNMGNVCEK